MPSSECNGLMLFADICRVFLDIECSLCGGDGLAGNVQYYSSVAVCSHTLCLCA